MTTQFLREPRRQLQLAAQTVQVSPASADWQQLTSEVLAALDAARLEITMQLSSMSPATHFRQLERLVNDSRDELYKAIVAVGFLDRDFAALSAAAMLLDQIGIHVKIRANIDALTSGQVSIGSDSEALVPSMTKIRTRFEEFRAAFEQTCRTIGAD